MLVGPACALAAASGWAAALRNGGATFTAANKSAT
jgi:hypothetical protein